MVRKTRSSATASSASRSQSRTPASPSTDSNSSSSSSSSSSSAASSTPARRSVYRTKLQSVVSVPSPVAISSTPQTSRAKNSNKISSAHSAAATVDAVSTEFLFEINRARDAGKLQFTEGGDQYITDIHSNILYQPHTVTALFLTVALLFYFTLTSSDSNSALQNAQTGVGIAAGFLLMIGLLVFPSGPFIRPHPLIWRLAFGVGVLYQLFLILILFQSKSDAREAMKFFDPKLGIPVADRSYAENCEFTVDAIARNIDRFVVSHFIGWIIKALLIRDALICWIISIQWELVEIGLTHWLPNFAECWWDQWLLDVLLSNGIGIYVGGLLCEYLEMKDYQWTGVNSIPTIAGKVKRGVMQFTPASWIKVRWESTSTISRFVAVNCLIVAFHVNELNAFLLKHLLWIPPESSLNVYRLGVWAFIGVPCLRQIYAFMTDQHCKRIGMQTFLAICILSTELLIIFKFSTGEFPNPMPEPVRIGWSVAGILYALFFIAFCMKIHKRNHS